METSSNHESYLATQSETFLREITSSDWTSEKKTKFYELFLRKTETSKTVKVTGVFNSSPTKIKDLLLDAATLTKYDDTKGNREEIESGLNYKIFLTKGNKIIMVDPRDTCIILGFKVEPNGTILIAGGSIEHSKAPEVKGRVRAFVQYTGYLLEPVVGDANKCKFTYSGMIDPKGSVPGMVVNKILMKQGEILENLDEYAKKN